MLRGNDSYTFNVNDTWIFFRLVIVCVLEFLILSIIFLWWLITVWKGGSVSLLIGLSLLVVLPVFTYYLLRKKATVEVTVLFMSTEMEIRWPVRKMVVAFADIKSYSAGSIDQESYERESVNIRLINGKKIQLSATSDLCNIKPLRDFRKEFDRRAKEIGLREKLTWDERLLMKK